MMDQWEVEQVTGVASNHLSWGGLYALQSQEKDCACTGPNGMDGALDLEAFVVYPPYEDGTLELYVLVKRTCGGVWLLAQDELISPRHAAFWWFLQQRLEKRCASLYAWARL